MFKSIFSKGVLTIPTPEEFMNSPTIKKHYDKEFNKAVTFILDRLTKEFVGTSYVNFSLYDTPEAVKPRVFKAFKDKGWKILKTRSRSGWGVSYYIGLPSFQNLTEGDIGYECEEA